ncbi:MAG: hypothetical protein A3F77_00295 [Betaproteobacteria bacterium RIFCSPLOWO2_12_FULL_67_28]|nr:MAG: hypothetical protein A3F77_00295 [Betaproteobacteria bacterium RIFCSPLOWO2_12_FULL_67_28]
MRFVRPPQRLLDLVPQSFLALPVAMVNRTGVGSPGKLVTQRSCAARARQARLCKPARRFVRLEPGRLSRGDL